MHSHADLEAMRAMIVTNKFMVYALMKTHLDPLALRSAFIAMTQAYVDEQSTRVDNEIYLKSLKANIETMERMLVSQSVAPHRR